VAVHQLQHLALGDGIGGVRQHAHHAHAVHADHHLESAGIQEIADQHGGRIAESRVGGAAPAPQLRFIHHVVVQQGCGMNEFDDRRELMVQRAPVAVRPRRQHHQRRPQTLTAATNDMFGDLGHQRDIRMQPRANDAVYRLHVRGNELADGFYGHGTPEKIGGSYRICALICPPEVGPQTSPRIN